MSCNESSCGCDHGHADSKLPREWLVAASGAFTGAGLLLHWAGIEPAALQIAAFAIATLAGGALVFPAALRSLGKRRLDMNVLMTVAVAGAWLIRQEAEGASVVFLFALSELLESWAEGRAHRAIGALLELSPETALVQDGSGTTTEKPVAEVAVGATVLVKSGSRVPLDGEVIQGESSVNQAPITGESIPVDKKAGDPVYAGTINGNGSLQVRVTKAAADSTLSRIIKLVEEASEQKAPTQRFVDRFAAIYTPAVFVAALGVGLVPPLLFGAAWGDWIYRALVLLVIACPCALVIATPVSIVSGLTAMARRGVLIKGGAVLEAVGKLQALAVDKTGTITMGKPQVTGVIVIAGGSEAEILEKAAAIDSHSEHPLAQAITAAAAERGIHPPAADNYQTKTGMGASGIIDGHPYFVGNRRMAEDAGALKPALEQAITEIQNKGESLTVVGHRPHDDCPQELLGAISIGDTIRPEASAALAQLHRTGIRKIVMLSGDNQRTASAIAAKVGIDEAIGDLMPEQKIEHLRRLLATHGHVGMIGDGVNDAPALALASVGIAMGAIGSDTAIETADMALMKDDLSKVAESIILGRRVLRIIRFNVSFALTVKAVFLILAFTGHAGLWLAILADTGATLLVIMNSLRLLKAPHQD